MDDWQQHSRPSGRSSITKNGDYFEVGRPHINCRRLTSKPKQSPNPQNTRSSHEDEPNVIQKLNTSTQPTKICPQSDPHKDEGLFRPHHNINCEEEERQRNKKWWLQHCVTDYSPGDRLSAGAALRCQATQSSIPGAMAAVLGVFKNVLLRIVDFLFEFYIR